MKLYKYLNNLQIFSLNIAMCSEIVLSLCTVQNYYSLKEIVPLRTSGIGRTHPRAKS